jgi:hypothetical protein
MKFKLILILMLVINPFIKGIYAQQNAIIIGNEFTKSAPNYDSTNLFLLKDKDLVSILEISENKDLSGTEPNLCDSFPWVQISTSENQVGWVLGKYVFKILANYYGVEPVKNMTVTIDSIDYHLAALRNFSIGPDDSNGLTGCSGFHPLLFYNDDYSHVELIKYGSPCENSIYLEYCNIVSDANRGETIQDIEAGDDDSIILKIFYSLQEGGGAYDLRVTLKNNELVGEVENLKQINPRENSQEP